VAIPLAWRTALCAPSAPTTYCAQAAHLWLGSPPGHQLHGLGGQSGRPWMTGAARPAFEDQRREPSPGQLQGGRKPSGAGADDQDLDAFFFVTGHENPPLR
jgi:hypothetical protein